jgi:predicted HTH transcriptional regulator
MTIQGLIRKGESETVEFKESFSKEIRKNLKVRGYEL